MKRGAGRDLGAGALLTEQWHTNRVYQLSSDRTPGEAAVAKRGTAMTTALRASMPALSAWSWHAASWYPARLVAGLPKRNTGWYEATL